MPDSVKVEADKGVITDEGSCDVVSGINHAKLIKFRVQLVDMYGVPTFSEKREEIKLRCQPRLPDDADQTLNMFDDSSVVDGSCDARGGVIFDRLITNVEDPKLLNELIPISVEVTGPPGFLNTPDGQVNAERLLYVRVAPSKRPSKIQVWWTSSGGQETRIDEVSDGKGNYFETVGVTLDTVFVRLFNECEEPIELPKGAKLIPSWGNRKKPCTTVKMPALSLPTQMGDHEYDVSLRLPKQEPVELHFVVECVAGAAKRWQVQIQQGVTNIQCGEKNQLSQAASVFIADDYGNPTGVEGDIPVPEVFADGPTIIEKTQSTLQLKKRRTSTASSDSDLLTPVYFEFKAGAMLFGKPCSCTLRVCSTPSSAAKIRGMLPQSRQLN